MDLQMIEQRGPNRPFFQPRKPRPLVIAHRGGAGEWPGETIYAFQRAKSIGVDVLEMDIRYTSDDDLVLMHNRNVNETTGVDKHVEQFTSADIQLLDAAYRWREAGKVFPPGARLGVPRLEDVLREFNDMRMNIEIKPWEFPIRLVKKFCGLLRDCKMTDKVLVASGWYKTLLLFRRECKEVATSASVIEMAAFRGLKAIKYRPNTDAIQTMSRFGRFERITGEFINRAHDLDLLVHGWTVNKPEEMGRLKSLDVDGIITDHPTTLLEILGRRPAITNTAGPTLGPP